MIPESVKIIKLNDFSEYDPEKCNNGGCYGFWTKFTRMDNNPTIWEISYHTTAEFDYCPCCGAWGDHYPKDDDCDTEMTCGDFDTVSTTELVRVVEGFQQDHASENTSVEFIDANGDAVEI